MLDLFLITILLLFSLLIGLGLLLVSVLPRFIKTTASQRFYRKKPILTAAEQRLYMQLKDIVKDQQLLFVQVRLADIIDPVSRLWEFLRPITYRSVDFVICDKSSLQPDLVIELDDKTHLLEDRMARDKQVDNMLAQAGIPMLRMKVQRHYDMNELGRAVYAAMGHTA